MEKRKDAVQKVSNELKIKTEGEIARLREELARLKALKRQKEQMEQATSQGAQEVQLEKEKAPSKHEEIESRLKTIEQFLGGQITKEGQKSYKGSEYVESQLQVLEQEIVGETGLIEEELSPYDKLLKTYPWLEEPRYEFMYSVPNKKKNQGDYESWREEWAKILYDYSRYAVLHILYLRQLYTEKPFSNFQNRKVAIEEIVDELINQDLAKWISKKKDKLRIYWKTLDLWADEIYDWAIEFGKLEPILIYELREANEDFSTLPQEDIEEVFKMLSKDKKAVIIKLEDGQPALKIEIE